MQNITALLLLFGFLLLGLLACSHTETEAEWKSRCYQPLSYPTPSCTRKK